MIKFIFNKKPILSCIGFLFLLNFCNAQSFNRIEYLISVNDLHAAKEAVDSIFYLDKTAAASLVKAKVYAAIARDPASKAVASNAGWEAFQALQNGAETDKVFIDSALRSGRYQLLYDLFDQFNLEGIVVFNTAAERRERELYGNALAAFKKAAAVRQLLARFDAGKTPVDTTNLLYLAKSSIYADKEIDAIIYCKKIIDNNFIFEPFKAKYEQVFQWMVFYYKGKRDEVNFYKYLHLANQVFPASSYFKLLEIDWLRDQEDYKAVFEKYRNLAQELQADPSVQLAYYRDLFHIIWDQRKTGSEPSAADAYKKELVAGLENFIKIAPKQMSPAANLLLAKTYRNLAADIKNKSLAAQKRNFLLQSNRVLKTILQNPVTRNSPAGKEAVSLLKLNNIVLNVK